MNINKLTESLTTGSRSKPQDSSSAKSVKNSGDATQAPRESQPKDKVMLSANTSSMREIEADIKAMPIVDDAVVDKIRGAIENGEYKIDYDKLAGNMLSFEDNLS